MAIALDIIPCPSKVRYEGPEKERGSSLHSDHGETGNTTDSFRQKTTFSVGGAGNETP